MKTPIKTELAQHLLNLINDGVLTDENRDDWHFHAFNEDYYIIGYYQCNQWLKKHDIDAFEAIEEVINYSQENFGEMSTAINSEAVVNMLAFIYGEELLSEIDANSIEELKDELQELVS